jgi:hypothetical protein
MTKVHSVLIRSSDLTGEVDIQDGVQVLDTTCPFVDLSSCANGNHPYSENTVTFAASIAPVTLLIDIHAG